MLYGPNQGGRGKYVLLSYPRETPSSLSDSLGTNDTLDATIGLTLSESIGLQDAPSVVVISELADSIGFTDVPVALSIRLVTVSDSIGFNDTLASETSLVLADSIGFQDASSAISILVGRFYDSVGFQDTSSAISVLIRILSESIGFQDALVPSIYQRAVVFSAETGAASTYEFPFKVTGVGASGRTLYLTTENGLYALDAETDNGAAVTWEFRTGFSDFGSNMLKRIPDVSVLANGGTSATLVIVAGSSSGKQECNYPATAWGAPAPFGYVIHAGRGLKSVHYQFGLSGIGRANISAVKPTVELLSRRR